MSVEIDSVVAYLKDLQSRLCAAFEEEDASEKFKIDGWKKPPGAALGGEGSSRILEGGVVFERGGVGFSDVTGSALPPSATERNPSLAGKAFRAVGVSVVMHPRNPYAPTAHMNVRCFTTQDGSGWWFGGGFDLTPYYPFDEDVRAWHRTAHDACAPFGPKVYPLLKARCDSYFFLAHRNETRGVGGLFIDDLNAATPEIGGDPAHCFGLIRAIGDGFLAAYRPIVARRKNTSYGQREREFQLYRRGRYVEFNLVFDRGTLFGLQSKGRTESILMSMPPLVSWKYDYRPESGSAEAKLSEYLAPREWL